MNHCQRSFTVFLIFINLLAIAQTTPVKKIRSEPFSIGESIEIYSSILNENRVLNIYLPADYSADPAKKYPVIYLLDGSADEDFIHISGLVQFSTFPWVNMLPPSIVVGISNVNRKRDFTFPSNNEEDRKIIPASGGSANFMDFLEKEVLPFVEFHYRTDSVKVLIGQSLGGLLATEILSQKPELFTHYIIVSPSLWWDNGSLLNSPIRLPVSVKAVYVAVGKEGEIMEQSAEKLAAMVRENPGTEVYFRFFNGNNHANILHLAVYDAFETMFRRKAHSPDK